MKGRITRTEAKTFHRRWMAVEAAELEELRSTPISQKFRELATLMSSARQWGWTEGLKAGEDEVRKGGNRLRKALHA